MGVSLLVGDSDWVLLGGSEEGGVEMSERGFRDR